MASDFPKPGAAPAASKAKTVVEEVNSKIAVEATEKGWYDNSRKNPGDKFYIENEKSFSKNWMKKI